MVATIYIVGMSETSPNDDIERDFHQGFGDVKPPVEAPIEPAAAEASDGPPEATEPANVIKLSPDQVMQRIHESFGQPGIEATNLLEVDSMHDEPIDAAQAIQWTAGLSTDQLVNFRELYAANGGHRHMNRLNWVIGLRHYSQTNAARDPNAIGYVDFPG